MNIANKFESFCKNIRISKEDVENISYRCKRITKQLNEDFWDVNSETSHSLYVGSYGRDTEIYVSDIDILFRLPYQLYLQYQNYETNGQSSLLQNVRTSLQHTYSTSHIKADGQVIGINWEDGINFEIVPCFINNNGSYTYADSRDGGTWKVTNPKPEINEIQIKNIEWNYNLKRLCRMMRSWKYTNNVSIGGLLIDTFAYNFLENWQHSNKSFLFYDWMLRDFFYYIMTQNEEQTYWLAPGSGQKVDRKGLFNYKSKVAYNLTLDAIAYEDNGNMYSANLIWRKILGTKFNS